MVRFFDREREVVRNQREKEEARAKDRKAKKIGPMEGELQDNFKPSKKKKKKRKK